MHSFYSNAFIYMVGLTNGWCLIIISIFAFKTLIITVADEIFYYNFLHFGHKKTEQN